jgi:hypothetical protein
MNRRSRDHIYINNYHIFGCGCEVRTAPKKKKVEDTEGLEVLGGASCFICASSLGLKVRFLGGRSVFRFFREGPKDG